MKSPFIHITAVCLVTAFATAAEEELFPPEYAALYTESMAVTPKEAIAAVIEYGDLHRECSGAKIFAPISLKCRNGLTASYVVMAYAGNDITVIESIQYLTKQFNEDKIKDLNKVLDTLDKLSTNKDLYSYMVSAWKWDVPVVCMALGGPPLRLVKLPEYIARAHLEVNNIEYVRFCYSSPGMLSKAVLYVKTGSGDAYYCGHEDKLTEKGETELRDLYSDELPKYLELFNNKEFREKNLNAWKNLHDLDIEQYFKDGYYRIEEYDVERSSHIDLK